MYANNSFLVLSCDRVLRSPGWPQTCYAAKDSLEHLILLPPPPEQQIPDTHPPLQLSLNAGDGGQGFVRVKQSLYQPSHMSSPPKLFQNKVLYNSSSANVQPAHLLYMVSRVNYKISWL